MGGNCQNGLFGVVEWVRKWQGLETFGLQERSDIDG